jgi:predicted translin family RNA/ssDNA-binding protein
MTRKTRKQKEPERQKGTEAKMQLLSKKGFSAMKLELENYDEKRERIIIASREVLKASKLVIFSLQREDLKEAKKLIGQLEAGIKKIHLAAGDDEFLRTEGSYNIAMQEYTEAVCFYTFINKNKIPGNRELKVDAENYLLGLCDLTGELERKAVILATQLKFSEVEHIKKLIEDILGEIIMLNPRNNELRKKADSIK